VLADCLTSVSDTVDEIVVVDTGSTDESKAIASTFGARLLDVPWTDDFAAARNAGLDAAQGRWILYIDADERLRDAGAPLRAQLDTTDAIACTVLFHQRIGWTAYREHRLFKNDPRIRFEGAIHETLRPSFAAVGGRIDDSGAAIDHIGYEGDRTRKWKRNLPILEREVRRWPDRIYLWHDLGWSLHGLGRHEEAEAAWSRGVEVATARGECEPPDIAPFLDLIVVRLRDGRPVDDLIAGAARCDPANLALQWLRVRWHLDNERPEEALDIARELAAVDVDALDGGVIGYERAVFERDAPSAVALCLFKLGRYDESADAYERLAASCPDEGEAREWSVKAAMARAKARR
jgi:tetratricopeptide (TPR) repeat protein